MKIPTYPSPKGLRGFLLFDINGRPIFRVYRSEDKREFDDYWIRTPDLQVEIIDDYSVILEESIQNPDGLHKLSGRIDVEPYTP